MRRIAYSIRLLLPLIAALTGAAVRAASDAAAGYEAAPAAPAAEESPALIAGRAALQDGLYDTAADY